jgi:Asp-tRNA(Asn)/Glu-tRNA(Gln) amidotransferase A subunit family amidase
MTVLPVDPVACRFTAWLPVGLQVVGPHQGEESVLALAAVVQHMNGGVRS